MSTTYEQDQLAEVARAAVDGLEGEIITLTNTIEDLENAAAEQEKEIESLEADVSNLQEELDGA